MRYTQKIALIFLSVCLLATQAQSGLKIKRPGQKEAPVATVSRRAGWPKHLDLCGKRRKQILEARVARTFQQAQQAPHPSKDSVLWEPIPVQSRPVRLFSFNSKHIYPDKPFLAHPIRAGQLTEAYILAQNNRLFLQHLRRMKAWWPQFIAAIPRFQKEARSLPQPKNPLRYAVEQIPPTVKNIFLGEVHDQQEIVQFISQMLPLLRQKYKNTPIFMFAEFLPAKLHKGKYLPDEFPGIHEPDYTAIWESAAQEKIPLIGLEPPFAHNYHEVKTYSPKGEEEYVSLWGTMEGMRLRNEYWWNILQQYRAQNPEAIFVVYTGSAHSLYTLEFSLAARLPQEETFMLELVMSQKSNKNNPEVTTDNLEGMYPQLNFPQTVLHWKTKGLAQLSGFDMRIRVPSHKFILRKQLSRPNAPAYKTTNKEATNI